MVYIPHILAQPPALPSVDIDMGIDIDITHHIVARFFADQVQSPPAAAAAGGRQRQRQRPMLRAICKLFVPLMSVDRHWRRAALRCLRKSAICEQDPNTGQWRTNFELLTTAPQPLSLYISASARWWNSPTDLGALLLSSPGLISSVKKLHFSVVPFYYYPGTGDQQQHQRSVSEWLKLLQLFHFKADKFNDLLLLTGCDWNELFLNNSFLGLCRANICSTAAAAATMVTQLVELRVRCDSHAALPLAQRLANSLRVLELVDIPQTKAWDMLRMAMYSHDAPILFPSLHTLTMQFLANDNDRGGTGRGGGGATDADMGGSADRSICLESCRSAFICLRSLTLCGFPLDMRICLAVFPTSQLHRLHLELSWHALKYLPFDFELPRIADVHVACTGPRSQIGCKQVAELVHSVILRGAVSSSSSSSSNISSSRSNGNGRCNRMRVAFTLHHALQPCHWPLSFAGMSCDLRSLELHITIYLSAVVDLLQHMPLLHRLSIPYISTAPESFLAASVSGCGARLETLQMGFCDYQMSTSSLCLAVLEFVAGFERLLWLVHEPGFAAELRGCIKIFAARRCLPHLTRVCIDDLGGGAQAPA